MITLRTHASGSGPAVLWIHGYTMDSSLWAELWDMARPRRCRPG